MTTVADALAAATRARVLVPRAPVAVEGGWAWWAPDEDGPSPALVASLHASVGGADGVVAAGECEGDATPPLTAVERKPTELLRLLDDWFAPFEEGEITMLVRSTDVPIVTWTTRSAGMALYWTAVVLGKTWPPAATLGPLEPSLRHLMPRRFAAADAFAALVRSN